MTDTVKRIITEVVIPIAVRVFLALRHILRDTTTRR
jgi:hypothetical protein